jgi:hypothetical protein
MGQCARALTQSRDSDHCSKGTLMKTMKPESHQDRASTMLFAWCAGAAIVLAACTAAPASRGPGGAGGTGGGNSQGGAGGGAGAGGSGNTSSSGGAGGVSSAGGGQASGGATGGSGGSAGQGSGGVNAGGAAGSSARGGAGGAISGGGATAASGGAGGGAAGGAAGAGGTTRGAGGATTGAGGSTVTCASGQATCYGACVDLQSDAKNCGKCGTVCDSDVCNAGVCKKVKDCYKKTVLTDPSLADFEDYDGTTAAASWSWAINAPAGSANAVYAGLYEYDDGTGSPAMSIAGPGNASSKYAAKLAAGSQASKWGGALGIWMGCVDASAYQGISFWVKGTAPTGTATVTLAAEATSAPDSTDPAAGGTCTSGTCAAATKEFPVTTSWSQVLVTWDTFTAGTANGATVTTSGNGITGLSWNVGLAYHAGSGDAGYVPTAASYDIEVDDVQFIGGTACDGTLKLCGTACTDATTDKNNCGTCGNVCPQERTCTAGKCVCPSGYSDCSGQCVDFQVDAQNCGGCGKACTGQCAGGGCQASACAANMAQKDKTSTKDASITLGKYWINNNQWGASNGSGSQSIWDTCSSGNTIGWGTEWDWTGSASQVKTYASAVLGWQWGWKISNTGLPVQLSSGKTISCGWTYRVQPGQTIDVSYDMFAHTQSNPGTNDDPSDEIMIWLYRSGGAAPIGGTSATVTIGGASWELHEGSNGRWAVHSYVRTSNADTGATLNIMDFFNDLTANRGMAKSKYLTSIQSGTEVFIGSGRLDTDQYYCTVQ